MYKIYDNNNSIDVRNMSSLDDTTPYCKNFSICKCNFNYIMYSFDDRSVMAKNVRYESSNLIFDANIGYNNC